MYQQTTGLVSHSHSVAKYRSTKKGRLALARGQKKYRQRLDVRERINAYYRDRARKIRELRQPSDLILAVITARRDECEEV